VQNTQYLIDLGWEAEFASQVQDSEIVARVVGEEKGLYRIQFSRDVEAHAIIIGKFRHQAKVRSDYPAVGDWIVCEKPQSSEHWVVVRILDRKSCLSRKVAGDTTEEQIIATNIDYVMIATSCNQNFNIARVERYLTLAWSSGAKPLVLLTKSDLVQDKKLYTDQFQNLGEKVEYLFVSREDANSIHALKSYFLPNKTNVIVGSSGVGKSTLINLLLGEEKLKTQDIRDEDGKGKHTTTARYLLQLPFGGMMIDTPGMREVQVLDVEEGLESQFDDVEELKLKCKFSDCGHKSEPGCAIKNAISNGSITNDRWNSYIKLQKEVLVAQAKTDKRVEQDQKKQWKKKSSDFYDKEKFKKK
jgi:ribosome biogenesis GTPase